MIDKTSSLSAIEAIAGRRSVRRFLATPIADETIHAILEGASRAASGTNIQPWMVHVVTGDARQRLSHSVVSAATNGELDLEYRYLPDVLKEPYLSRRRKIGFELFAKYGIERNDMAGRQQAMLRNYDFFGAPVGLFVTMERDMALGAWLDCGMFMQNIMVLARAYGLETCPQQAWCDYGPVVHRVLGIPQEHIILSGMSIGVADLTAIENTLVSERVSVEEFTTWHR